MREFCPVVNEKRHAPFRLRARLQSFLYAGRGLRELLRCEHNARIHLAATLLACALAFWLQLPCLEWVALVFAFGLVWCAEALNSAVETLADRLCKEEDDLIRRAKDYAAAAVLVSALCAALIGALLFIPRLIEKFSAL